MLISKTNWTVDNLKNQLCAYEKALLDKRKVSVSQEVLVTSEVSGQKFNEPVNCT